MEESFIQEPEHKKKSTILHGRQAEKVQKALQKAAEARERRDLRQQEVISCAADLLEFLCRHGVDLVLVDRTISEQAG